MLPDDRVLVGVVNRKRDFYYVRDAHWYRIPQERMKERGVYAEYIGFYLSRAFKERNGGIHYFARRTGLELARRKDLLPDEANHKRANDVYYKVQLDELIEKVPPVLNPTKRPISFVYTTWDRFVNAETIMDLYSTADYFVDRIYHALRDTGIRADILLESEYADEGLAPRIRILCEKGDVIASTDDVEGDIFLDETQEEDEILAKILDNIARQGGPVMVNIPLEGFD